MAHRQRSQLDPPTEEERIGADQQRLDPGTDQSSERGLDRTVVVRLNHADLDPIAATVTSFVTASDGELLGLTSSPIRLTAGTSSCSSPNSFAAQFGEGKVDTPAGRS